MEKSLYEECRRSGLSQLVNWLFVREHADLYASVGILNATLILFQISIPVLSVTLLKKTKTALLVPNALIIATVTDRVSTGRGQSYCTPSAFLFFLPFFFFSPCLLAVI